MSSEFAISAAIHADRDLAREAVRLEPALGRHGLHQAIGAPWEAGGDARNYQGDALDQGAGLSVHWAGCAVSCGRVEGDDIAWLERQVADAGERKLADGAQAGG